MLWLLVLVAWFVLSVPACALVGRSLAAADETLAAADAAARRAAQRRPTHVRRVATTPLVRGASYVRGCAASPSTRSCG